MVLYHLLIYLFIHPQTLTEHLYSNSPCDGCYWAGKKEYVKKERREWEGGKKGQKEGDTKLETKPKNTKFGTILSRSFFSFEKCIWCKITKQKMSCDDTNVISTKVMSRAILFT